MKKCLSFFVNGLLLCFTIVLHAQQLTFSKVLYDSIAFNGIQAHSIVSTNDNGCIIVGEASSQKGLIIKVDSTGNLVWGKIVDNQNTNVYPDVVLNDVTATNDSCFLLVGRSQNSTTGHVDACCIKISSNGDTLWSKTISYNGYDINALSVQQTIDSGYIITGYRWANTAPYNKIFVAKLNVTGNLEWSTILTGGDNSNIGNSVKQTADSGYVITGLMENYPPYDPNAFLIKLSSAGLLSWAKKYHLATEQFCSGNDVVITSNGFLCYLNTGNDITIMKTDFSGNFLWKRSCYGPAGYDVGRSPKLHKTSDNGYVFVRRDACTGGGGLTKIDSLGNIVWAKRLFLDAVDVIESKDNGLFIVGNGPLCAVRIQPTLDPQIGIIKTDSLGNAPICVSPSDVDTSINNLIGSSAIFTTESGATGNSIYPGINSIIIVVYPGCVEHGSGMNESEFDNRMLIYPNPSGGIFKFHSDLSNQHQITIFNTFGEKIYQSEFFSQQSEIDLSSQAKGIYFYQTIFSNNKFATGKLLIK